MPKRTKAELMREIADLRAQLADMEAAALMKAADQEKREPAEGPAEGIAEARGRGEKALEAAGEAGEAAGGEGGPFPIFDNPKKNAFLQAYIEMGGHVSKAARAARVDRSTPYNWLAADPAYKEAFERAREQAADVLEAEVIRRGAHGIDEPVFYQGKVVGQIRKYSDNLLMFMLKGLRPAKFRDNYNPALFQASGNINVHLNVPRPGQEGAASEKKRPKVQIDPAIDVEARELPG